MLDKVLDWLRSELNVFVVLGCTFDIIRSPEKADIQSVAVDFELESYFCRLTFWEAGNGHIEVIDIGDEKTFIDEGFDIETEFSKAEPFKCLAQRLQE